MSLAKLASVAAHQFLTELIGLEAIPPDGEVVAVARSTEHGLRIVVSITKDEGPARLHLIAPLPSPPVPVVTSPPLREIEQNILEAAPGPDGPPISAKSLARLAGYGYNSYFLAAVRGLIPTHLEKLPKGVRRQRTS